MITTSLLFGLVLEGLMVFGFLSKKKAADALHYAEGQKLFELGMICASKFESEKALEYYRMSIEACKNPSPYINRANLLGKRMRDYEALCDLLEAKKLDEEQGNEFKEVLRVEIIKARAVTEFYSNGMRAKLLADHRLRGSREVATKIFCSIFGIEYDAWKYGNFNRRVVEFHFFNEIDNIVKFDNIDAHAYGDVKIFSELFDPCFVDLKISQCPSEAFYTKCDFKMHGFLCVYPQEDMRLMRNNILYTIHQNLMMLDHGETYGSLASDCTGLTKEAEIFMAKLHHDR